MLSVQPSFYEEDLDLELEKLLPQDIEIIRTAAWPVRPIRCLGDIGIRAFASHYYQACQMAKARQVDLIYIPIPPNYPSLIGPLIYRRFRIPYAIDYIDPWVYVLTQRERMLPKAQISAALARWLEPMVLRQAKLVTAVAPGYYEGALKRYPWLDASKCMAIPYGAEQAEFDYLDKNPRQTFLFNPFDGNYHIVYAGTMLPKAYETLKALYGAILILKKNQPTFFRKLKFHFIGTGNALRDPKHFVISSLAEQYGLADSVREYPLRIPYLDTLNHLKNSAAVLIMGSTEAHYTPSKVFQAILSRRPVLALLHSESTAVNILNESGIGLVVTFDETKKVGHHTKEIADAITRAIHDPYSLDKINWNAISGYSTEHLVGCLAKRFDSILEQHSLE